MDILIELQDLDRQVADLHAKRRALFLEYSKSVVPWEFTQREREIIDYILSGMTRNKDIADALCISERTVRCHIYNIMNKTGIRSRAELAVRLMDWRGAV
jgi:DNA-binding NarL/FixJ family response regulator